MAVNSSVKSGDLRHLVTIQNSSQTRDISGTVLVWDIFADMVPAAIEPARATDIIRSGQNISEIMIPITIRYMPGVTPDMRVVHDADTYIIQGILDPDKRRRKLILMCLALGSNQ